MRPRLRSLAPRLPRLPRLPRVSRALGALGLAAALTASATVARAATLEVGPGKQYAELSAIARIVKPGDVVEVQGDHTYAPVEFNVNGTQAAPITIRGVRVNGKRPIVKGGENTVLMHGNFYVFEGFEVTGGSGICVVHKANGITLRDDVIHDCPRHGILGTDQESGSLLMEYVEVYAAGSERSGEALKHPVYIATDEKMYPKSVFRMQHCYVHDANGGNSVKSRAERSEIYGNWLEGAQYYEIELIGPDDDSGDTVTAPREDGDVVGNVLFQTKSTSYVVRVGGDGTGRTGGRYRFVNNTFILGSHPNNAGALRASYALDSLELYNNVFSKASGPMDYLVRETDLTWISGRQIAGANNYITQGSGNIPATLTGNILGTNPGFVDLAKKDVRLAAGSPLIDKGTATTARTDAFAFPSPLAKATHTPPLRVLASVGRASPRLAVGALDVGAFELGSPTEEPGTPGTEPPPGPSAPPPGTPEPPPGLPGLPGSPGASDDGGAGGATPTSSGCGCGSVGTPTHSLLAGAGLMAALGLLGRARARRRR